MFNRLRSDVLLGIAGAATVVLLGCGSLGPAATKTSGQIAESTIESVFDSPNKSSASEETGSKAQREKISSDDVLGAPYDGQEESGYDWSIASDLTSSFTLEGISLWIDKSWQQSYPRFDNHYDVSFIPAGNVRDGFLSINVDPYTHGETKNVRGLVENGVVKYVSNLKVVSNKVTNGITYYRVSGKADSEYSENSGGEISFLGVDCLVGYDPNSNKGFCIAVYFPCSASRTRHNVDAVDKIFERVRFDPSQTTLDSLDEKKKQ